MSELRPPDQVMRLKRLGASHQTRLSFMRVLLRGLRRGGWEVDRPLWEIDEKGVGRAVYRIRGEGQCYSLVAFAHDLPDELRSDREQLQSFLAQELSLLERRGCGRWLPGGGGTHHGAHAPDGVPCERPVAGGSAGGP